MPTFAEVGRTIAQNLNALNKPGVLSVRPGYRLEGGWPVGDPIIVALVGAKKGEVDSYGLPAQIGGVPVEIRDASPLGRLKATRPETYAAARRAHPRRAARARFPVRACLCRTIGARRPRQPQPAVHEKNKSLTSRRRRRSIRLPTR